MRIIVNTPLMGDKVIETLTSYKEDNLNYVLISRSGMKLEFEINLSEADKAVDLTKNIIRNQRYGNALYFQVTAV